jgi:hypothetical protein
LVPGLLREVGGDRVIVAVDPGEVVNRVWVTTAEGLVGEPLSVPSSRSGLDRLAALIDGWAGRLFAVEAIGSLHRAWAVELERRWPGSLRLFARSEDPGRQGAAGKSSVQDRRSRLRGAGVARAPGRRAPGARLAGRGAAWRGRASPAADPGAHAVAPAAA